MKKKLAVALTLTLACLTSLPAQVENRELKSGRKQIRSIVLMPMKVSIAKIGMKGTEPLTDQERDAALPLSLEIDAVLRNLRYRLDMQSLSPEMLGKDPDERYAVDDLQKSYDAQLHLLEHKSKGVRKGRFSLGDEVLKLPLSDKVDALLFVRASGQMLTENKTAFGVFVAGPSTDFTAIDFGLVDAETGDVLYFAKSRLEANLVLDPEEILSGITRAFAGLPKTRSSPLRAQHGMALSNNALGGSAVESSTPSEGVTLPATAGTPVTGAPTRRIRLSSAVVKDLLIRKVAPEYPGIAAANSIHGDVVMEIVIDRNGQVADVRVVSGPMQLIPAATSSVKQWSYRPLTINGQVYEVETRVVETFQIGQ